MTIKPVYVDPEPRQVPRITLWNWVEYYVFNLVRKPKVWARKRELIRIANGLRDAISSEVLPQLWRVRLVCPSCKDAYMALSSQVFSSNIKMILQRLACDTHPEAFNEFLTKHRLEFDRSEEISAWINGFRR